MTWAKMAWLAVVTLAAAGSAGCGSDGSTAPVPGLDDATSETASTDVGADATVEEADTAIDDTAIATDTGTSETTLDVGDDAVAMDSGGVDTGVIDTSAIDSTAETGCAPGSTEPCYSGSGADVIGGTSACRRGTRQCIDGSFGPCIGSVLPSAESCGTVTDDNCDGTVNEGCLCTPFATRSCYSGPAGTQGVGICAAGTQTCNTDGSAWGPCTGEVVPGVESCKNGLDDDCDGTVNDGCAALSCPTFYSEDFNDGDATALTSGTYKVEWCNSYIPLATNTPLCMTGRTLRTNATAPYGGVWVSKATASCTSVRLGYDWYQFANAAAAVEFKQTSDTSASITSCNDTSGWTTAVPASSMSTVQACTSTTGIDIPFGTSPAVYIKFKGTNANAMWWDNIRLTLVGCDC